MFQQCWANNHNICCGCTVSQMQSYLSMKATEVWPLQSQIPWLWSLVMLQWFAEVRLRCEQVGFTEWGFREGNRYWIYRNPMEALPQSAHPPEILALHCTMFTSRDTITVQQPMQCSISNIVSKHIGVIHPTGNVLASWISSLTGSKLFLSASGTVCKPVLSIFLASLDHLSSRDMQSGCPFSIVPDLVLAFTTSFPDASSTSPLSPNLH